METMLMRVVVRNYFPNGRFENNTVEFLIPKEAGEIIKNAWHSKELSQCDPKVIKAKYLCTNQTASVGLYKDEDDQNGVAGHMGCPEEEIRKTRASQFVEATSGNSLASKYDTRWVVTIEHPLYDEDKLEYFESKEDALEYLEGEFEYYKTRGFVAKKEDERFVVKVNRGSIVGWVEEA